MKQPAKPHGLRPGLFFFTVCAVTCFSVFVVPFFLPPALRSAVSVSGDAGFNNRVAALAAGICAVAVFALSLLPPASIEGIPTQVYARDRTALPWRVWASSAILVGGLAGLAGWLIVNSKARYVSDFGYFVNQMSSSLLSHRQLYTQIEFPYGPLLFYPPIVLHKMLDGLPLQMCFLITLVLHQIVGLLLFGYVVNVLPMSRAWKVFAVCCFGVLTLEPMMAPNYTLLRFTIPLAALVCCAGRKSVRTTAILFVLGMVLTLAISPEMGLAFGAGAVVYAALRMRLQGRSWLLAAAMVPVAGALFLLIVGRPYLLMLRLFAGGLYNFIVEPVPDVLLFLLAAVWLVPRMLASQIRAKPQDAVLPVAMFVSSLALVPVAFGRADPIHVFFDGLGIFLLSFVAMSSRPRWLQIGWGACVAASMALGYGSVMHLFLPQVREVMQREARGHPALFFRGGLSRGLAALSPAMLKRLQDLSVNQSNTFDVNALQDIVGGDPVATPYVVPVDVEEQIRNRGLYRPDYFYFMAAVLDATAEDRKLENFNQARWAMLPTGPEFTTEETQASADALMGVALPYRAKREPYVAGVRFRENLHRNWQEVGRVDGFLVYCNTLRNARCGRH